MTRSLLRTLPDDGLRRSLFTAATLGGLTLLLTASPAVRAQEAPYQDYPQQSAGSQTTTASQQLQRCNTGRLLGGLAGGAIGYGASRGDGRYWAVPLGGLLGAQIGCNSAIGRGPQPF